MPSWFSVLIIISSFLQGDQHWNSSEAGQYTNLNGYPFVASPTCTLANTHTHTHTHTHTLTRLPLTLILITINDVFGMTRSYKRQTQLTKRYVTFMIAPFHLMMVAIFFLLLIILHYWLIINWLLSSYYCQSTPSPPSSHKLQ